MDAESAEKAKARRDRRILLVVALVGVTLPVVLFAVMGLKTSS